jgi:hypothetical protein
MAVGKTPPTVMAEARGSAALAVAEIVGVCVGPLMVIPDPAVMEITPVLAMVGWLADGTEVMLIPDPALTARMPEFTTVGALGLPVMVIPDPAVVVMEITPVLARVGV